jgi:hypothetical protein
VVEQTAGRGHQMSTPRLSASICGLMPTPPNITIERSFRYLP